MDIKNAAYPALHLWWRYTWRMWLFLFAVGSLLVIMGSLSLGESGMMFFAEMMKNHLYRRYTPYTIMKLMGIMTALILIFFIAALFFGVWLFRSVLFKKSFIFNDKPERFSVSYDNTILNIPVSWNNALGLWWGVVWRGFVLGIIARLLFFWTGPLMMLINIAVSYLAFLWLLLYNFGKTKIIVSASTDDFTNRGIQYSKNG